MFEEGDFVKKLVNVLIAVIIVFSCFFDQLGLYEHTFNIRDPFTINLFLLGLLVILTIYFLNKIKLKNIHILQKILALLFGIFMVLGDSFHQLNSWDMLFYRKLAILITIIRIIGYSFIFIIIFNYLNEWLNKSEKIKKCKSNFSLYFDNHPIKCSFIILTLAWLIYMIAFYPIILSPDPSYQILQFFNIPTKYITYAIPLSDKVNLTNHHPVLHTMLLGGFLKLGRLFGSDNLGLFFYSLFQTFVLMSSLIATIYVLKKENVNVKIRLILLCFYAFVPMFPFYAMSGVKDVLYTSFIIFYGIFIYLIVKNKDLNKKSLLLFLINIILVALFRNNGVYVVCLSLPFVIIFNKKYRKSLLLILIIFISFYISFDKVLLPSLKITSGSIREVLSIPFQQTARLAKESPESFTKEEKEVVDDILNFDTLAKRYDPEKSDDVKNKYDPKTTNDELKEYFKVWFSGLIKRPDVYVEATMNNVYGYFYPGHTRWYIYGKYYSLINGEGVVDYHYNSLRGLRNVLFTFGKNFPYIPLIGLLSNIGFYGLILLTLLVYIIIKKKYEYIFVILPSLISLLICIASPVNSYFRYAMPYIFFIPFVLCLFINEVKYNRKNTNN